MIMSRLLRMTFRLIEVVGFGLGWSRWGWGSGVAVYDGCWVMGLRRLCGCGPACSLCSLGPMSVCYSGGEAPQLGCVSVVWPERGSGQRGI